MVKTSFGDNTIMSILIGADIVPTEANKEYFASGNMVPVLGGKLMGLLSQVDYRVFNLETPLFNNSSPIKKMGPTLRADLESVKGLLAIKANLLTLANNHIMDHGERGLFSTLNVLKENHICSLGAAGNLPDARMPFEVQVKNKNVAFYACAEHEFSIASANHPGANPFDVFESFDEVSALKKKNDYVVVLFHGGKEYYRYPSPLLQKICRKFIENGADLVVCQHTHCIGCEEKYLNGTIVYGQGNFIFDSLKTPETETSLLIKLNDNFEIEYVPLEKYGCGVRLACDESARQILSNFMKRSEQIQHPGFVDDEYEVYAKKMLMKKYLLACSGYYHKTWMRLLNRFTGYRLTEFFVKRSFTQKELLALRNFIECEAHRELFLTGLKIENH